MRQSNPSQSSQVNPAVFVPDGQVEVSADIAGLMALFEVCRFDLLELCSYDPLTR